MAAAEGPVLTLDGALAGCGAGLVQGGVVLAERRLAGDRGGAAALPAMATAVLQAARVTAQDLSGVVVTVGPGSFTGVRAALALGQGIAASAGLPVWGVTVGAAIRAALRTRAAGGRMVWVVVDSRRGRVFLDDGDGVAAISLSALPAPAGPIAVAGDAAIAVAARLAARAHDVQLLSVWWPGAAGIAAAARGLAVPLYVDPPEARPGPGSRPAPA